MDTICIKYRFELKQKLKITVFAILNNQANLNNQTNQKSPKSHDSQPKPIQHLVGKFINIFNLFIQFIN
jgi:hypothetical protein